MERVCVISLAVLSIYRYRYYIDIEQIRDVHEESILCTVLDSTDTLGDKVVRLVGKI